MTDPQPTPDATPALPAAPSALKALAVLALAALFAYYNSLHGAYLLDDFGFLNDPNLDHPFKSAMAPRPVIAISLAANHRLDGINPRGYHAVNLAVHVLAALALFDLVRRTLALPGRAARYAPWAGWVALAAALVWMVHPLQTQAVTYIVQRCESMMGMFFLVALLCYVRGATADRGRWWYAGAVASCALGAGCKEMMIVLPPIALAYDRTFLSGSWLGSLRARWKPLLALSVPPVVGIGALVVTGFFTDPAGTVGFGVKVFTPYTYALTQTEVVLHYLRLSVWPVGQTLDYLDWPPAQSLAAAWPTVLAVGVLLVVVLVGVALRTGWGFLGLWFAFNLAPTSSIVPLQDAAFEHRMYLPLAAVVLLLVCGAFRAALWLGERLGDRRRGAVAAGWLAGGLVFVLGLMSVVRNEDYASAGRLYAENAALRPENGRVRLNLAVQLFASGDVAAADEQLDAALKLPLQVPSVRSERVRVFRESGRAAEAAALAQKLLNENPKSDAMAFELGLSLLSDGRPAEALPHLERMAAAAPTNKFARAHYGMALLATGKVAAADVEFRAADEIDPAYAGQLALAARRTALNPDARPANVNLVPWFAAAACRMKPAAPADFHDTYAVCLARAGRFAEAKVEAQLAADLARRAGDAYLASRIDARARLFEAGKPYLPD